MKTLTKILSILLAVMMLLSLVACDSASGGSKKEEKGSIVGKWKYEMPDDFLEKGMSATLEVDLQINKGIVIYLEFDEDGTMETVIDEDSMNDFLEEMVDAILEARAEEVGMSVNELLAEEGVTKDDYYDLISQYMSSAEFNMESAYRVDGNKLTMYGEDDTTTEDDSVFTFKLSGDKLTLTDVDGAEDMDEELYDALFPLVMKRVK